MFLAIAMVLQGCGDGSPLDGATEAGTAEPLSPLALATTSSDNIEIITPSVSASLAAANPELEQSSTEPNAISSESSVSAVSAAASAPASGSEEADVASAIAEPDVASAGESDLPSVDETPEVSAALPIEPPTVTETPEVDTSSFVDTNASDTEAPEVDTSSLVDTNASDTVTPEVDTSSTVDTNAAVTEMPEVDTSSPVDTNATVTESPEANTSPSIDADTAVTETSSTVEESVDAPAAPTNLDRSIVLGSGPGDAVCLHLEEDEAGFGGVSDSDWNRWVSEFHFAIGEEFLSVVPEDEGSNVLRQRFIPSAIGSDRAVVGARLPAHRTYRVTQSFFLEPGWDWGGRFEGGKLGFGFAGGTKPTGGTVDPNGFSARLHWRGNGDGTGRIVLYSYAADRPDRFGEDHRFGDVTIPIGEWFTVVMEVTANSSPQVSDGTFRGWIDGELVIDEGNFGWQLAGGNPVVDYMYYSGFYGGNSSEWSPSSTTHMKVRDVCWAAVVDGYSGIDPDNGRLVVASTENPDDVFADTSIENELVVNLLARQRDFVGVAEESLINIRTVYPVASLLTQRLYDEAIAELTAIVINADQVTSQSLSENPVPLLKNAADQLDFALSINEGNEVQTKGITGVQEAIRTAILRSSELAIAVVDNARSVNSCTDVESSASCSVANETNIEINSLLENLGSESISDAFITAETIWNRSVDALNSLNL